LSDELHAGHRAGRGDVEAERFWEDHYSRRGRVWSGRPNPVLVDVVGSLRPGTALDLGCGEGGDAIWLARQGWHVRAVDVSATALDRASADAATAGVADHIDFQRHDLALTFPSRPNQPAEGRLGSPTGRRFSCQPDPPEGSPGLVAR
jgi:SAM-dependent methyltransferase